MVVKVSIDPSSFQNQRGTLAAQILVRSTTAVNLPKAIRVLINLQDPDQRGTFVNVPGKLVDVLADPFRNRFFVLRQDTNEVLVFDGSNYRQLATLRTGNTPMSMALTFDRKMLMVGNGGLINLSIRRFSGALLAIALPPRTPSRIFDS